MSGISTLNIVNDVARRSGLNSDWVAELVTDEGIGVVVHIEGDASEERARGIVHEMVRPREDADGG